MKIRNNKGELIGEINSGVTSKGEVVTTNTRYDIHGNPAWQHLSIRRGDGTIQTTNVVGRKIIP